MTPITAPDESGYDAVFWDIGGVIVDLRSVREAYATFVAALVDEYDVFADDPLETWRSTLGEHFRSRDGTEYRTALEGYAKATEALFDDSPDASAWRPLLTQAMTEHLRPEDGAVETVRELDERGVYQAIISDIDTAEAESMLASFDLRDYFAAVTTSEAVGYTKPDERMFRTALAAWGGDPAQGLMIGDRYEHDIRGASKLGLGTAAYGEAAFGDAADHELTNLREVLDVV